MKEKGQPRGRKSPLGLREPEVGGQAQVRALSRGIAGGHGGCEKQEGRVQGWLQAGVQQAAAGSREQVGVSALPGTRQGTGQGGWAQVPEPLTDTGCVSAPRP